MMTYQNFETRINTLIGNRYIALSLLSVITVIVFFPTFSNELMKEWDDQWQVVNMYTSGGWSLANLKEIFCYSYHGQYSPLNQCLYIFIYELFGYTPSYYHGACLLLHILNTWLVYLLLRHILNTTTTLICSGIKWISFLVSLLFAIHPLQVESVSWVSASKIVLSSTFYLLATGTFLYYLEKGKAAFYILTILLFTCSYGSKEQAVTFPLLLVLISACYKQDLHSKSLWMKLAPFFLLALAFGLFFVLETKSTPLKGTPDIPTYTWWQRTVFSCYALVEYVWKWLFPYKLLYKYFYPMPIGSPLPLWMLSYPVLLAAFIVCLWKQLTRPVVLVGLVFFLIHILLVLHVIPINRQHIVADRYMYLPLLGLSFIGIYYLVKGYIHLQTRYRVCIVILTTGVLLALGSYSYHRTKMWHDTERLKNEVKTIIKEHAPTMG